MADIEYSNEYSVYMTPNGIRFLTNKVSIKIMGLLTVSERTVTEIAEILELSKSSIQSNMMKLARWELVVSNVDPADKRRVIYTISAMLLFKSAIPDDKLESETEDLIRHIISRDGDYFKNMILLTGIMPYRHGSTILPLMARVSGMVASRFLPRMKNMSGADKLAVMQEFSRSIGFPKTEVKMGERVTVRMDCNGVSDIESRVLRGLFAGFFNRYLYSEYGCWYYQTTHDITEDGFLVLEFAKYIGDDTYLNQLITDTPDNNKRNDWQFCIMSKGSETILFGNETQIKILGLLQGKKKSLKDISDELGIPPVTVHMNISKLMEVGVVVADNVTRSKYVFYTLDASPIAVPVGKEDGTFNKLKRQIDESNTEPSKFFEILSLFVIGIFRDAGIDVQFMLEKAGSNTASVYCKDNPDVTAQEFLEFVCDLSSGTGSKLTVNTYIPLCFNIDGIDGDLNRARYMAPMYKGMVETGLNLITGDIYRVSFKCAD